MWADLGRKWLRLEPWRDQCQQSKCIDLEVPGKKVTAKGESRSEKTP